MAPNSAPISIPTADVTMANGTAESQTWDTGRSPGRGGGGEPPRRSSRSRSPGRGNGDDRRYGPFIPPSFSVISCNNLPVRGEAGQNPGNNLHVSGLSTRVDTRDLEAAFAKIGRASVTFGCVATRRLNSLLFRLKKHLSCTIPIPASLAVSVS